MRHRFCNELLTTQLGAGLHAKLSFIFGGFNHRYVHKVAFINIHEPQVKSGGRVAQLADAFFCFLQERLPGFGESR